VGRVRLTRAGRSQAGVLVGGGTFTAGMWVGVGLAAGLMTGGVLLVAYCLFLMDTEGPEKNGGGP
jgi:hypothetical protein